MIHAVYFLHVSLKILTYLSEIVESIKRKLKFTLILFSRNISTTKNYILKATKVARSKQKHDMYGVRLRLPYCIQ